MPSGRLSRLGAFGKLAGGVAGGVVAEGARRLAAGERPQMSDLLLTPANARRVAEQLAQLRGAAMKLGQMISMDAGDMLPQEWAAIFARLREGAYHMPPQQLDRVLTGEWGVGWRRRFAHFQAHPIAAASIGQVHRARLPSGEELAIKVQYPGVRDSLDADVDNVATLLRVSGLMPKELDVSSLLAEAKRQLREEADYLREATMLERYAQRLGGEPGFVVPAVHAELTTANVLAMRFVAGVPIETLETAPQAVRDAAMTRLIAQVLRELLDWGLMQTDPNFANYRWQPDPGAQGGGRLVLLDFGATREVAGATADGYRRLLAALVTADAGAIRGAAIGAGFLGEAAAARHHELVDRMIAVVTAEFARDPFDFGDRAFVATLREQAVVLARDRDTWHLPPVDTLFVQRKISGTALLAARLKARVRVQALIAPYLG